MSALHAIVLAGGRARRLGGTDKVMIPVGGRPLLAGVVAALDAAERVVVVGPPRPVELDREVVWVREEPPFAGPATAACAGWTCVDAAPDDDVMLLPADLVRPDAVVEALGRTSSIVVDPDGRRQWACVRLRAAELDAAIRAAGDVSDGSLRALLGRLDLDEVVLSRRDCADLDTPDDVKEYGDEHR